MSGAPTPPVLPEAFAAQADPGFINTIPDTSADPQRASYELGFPPQTMTPVPSGGKPMLGPDMNGVLFAISSHTVYQQTGKPYVYSADVSTSIGGYAAGTILGMADGSGLWLNTVDANTNDPDAFHTAYNGWSALARYGYGDISGLTGGVATLNAGQWRCSVLILSGALVSNLQVVFPNTLQSWLIVNNTSGPFTTTVKTAAGTGVAIPQGGYGAPVEVYGNGVNLYPTVAPLSIPTDVGPTPDTYPLRSNNGDIFARLFNTNIGQFNALPVGSVFFEAAADGYIRKMGLSSFEGQMLLQLIGGAVTSLQVPQAAVTQYTPQILASAALTGAPTAPTPAAGDNSTKVATTAFVAGSVTPSAGTVNTQGSFTLPGGAIVKAGFAQGTAGGPGDVSVAFTTAFPNACWGVVVCTPNRTGAGSGGTGFPHGWGPNGFLALVDVQQVSTNGGTIGTKAAMWIAIGN